MTSKSDQRVIDQVELKCYKICQTKPTKYVNYKDRFITDP